MSQEAREIALLGRLTLKVRLFLQYTLMGYIFFTYEAIIVTGYLLSASTAVHLGLPLGPSVAVGVVASIIVSVIIVSWFASKIARAARLSTMGSPLWIWVGLGFVTGLIILVYPASGPVAWLPGLGAGLAWYSLTLEDRVLRRIEFATGILLLIASIPAVILVDVYLALGLLGVVYTLSALLSMNEAIRAFYQE